ncbi:MAG TPA: hypothetical protein VHS09_14555 [Polyangiaceae bacterium]|jgi:hypothetical protein|nr:hypothetical protein [Polyangiaceae bacterium]
MKLTGLLVAAFVAAGAVIPRPARASGDDVAAAQLLFDEGRRRMAQEDYAGACPKLAESQRLAPAVGTEFNLADCWEHVGKLASSWAAFLEVADLTHKRGESEREQAARRRADALAPRLGRLSIDVPLARRVADLEVRRDGEVVRDALWGIAVPVDAGDHRVEAHAPGRLPWSAVVHTRDGLTASAAVPDLAVAPPATKPPVDVSIPPPPEKVPSPPPSLPRPPNVAAADGPDHTAAFVVLGAAVVLAGVGIAGVVEHTTEVDAYNADATCPAITASGRPAHCNDLVNAASTWNTVAVVSFVASGIALVGGVTLWLVAPSPKTAGAAPTGMVRCFGGFASAGCAGTF